MSLEKLVAYVIRQTKAYFYEFNWMYRWDYVNIRSHT